MKKTIARTAALIGAFTLFSGGAAETAWSQSQAPSLFKVVTEKDDIIIGLNAKELQALAGSEKNAGAIARALATEVPDGLAVLRAEIRERRFAGRAASSGGASREPIASRGTVFQPPPVLPHE